MTTRPIRCGCAWTAVLLAAACGDGDALPKRSPDAAMMVIADAGTDASLPSGVKVELPGTACGSDRECTGSAAMCLRSLGLPPFGIELAGGYCTASCVDSDDCGASGGCPLGDLLSGPPFSELLTQPPFGEIVRGLIPLASLCWDRCSRFDTSACRAGYVCQSTRELLPPELAAQLGLLLFLPSLTTSYCMPDVDLGGSLDAGMRLDAGGPTTDADAGAPPSVAGGDALDAGIDASL